MRASRALAVAATACAVIGATAPTAAANNGPTNVTVSPTQVHQGGSLAVSAMGCGHGGTVSSNAFPKTALTVNHSGHSAATPRIYDHATPGQYNLAVRCSDSSRVVTRTFRVIRGRGAEGGLGGSMTPTSTEVAVGAVLAGGAALGGGLFLIRRRRPSAGRA
ncbi:MULTISPECIES: hypothetical protein [Streptomyces]|uniref:Gram-positive cocci surface proteins LPxTG domain-containing protein n=2 Tax=Streptomyces TaxID=1883 RepID=A0A100Y346_9ACTN|nr:MULTISPECIES: hypothetical protein [Streptomyces]KUH36824.1 hypothetical protein ATE80_21560 [Streptomyces kanasensis]UUS34147.1 hypothetical protein NRO40_27170 [Streptomyces changanensis]